jgi:cobalt-zinc-cadmium efflux system protein
MAAGVNAGWPLVLSVLVAAGAADRLLTGTHPVHGLPVLIISGAAATVIFAGALILARDLDGDLMTRAVSLDTAAAAGVAATGGVILATGRLFWLDPFVALIIALVIGYQAVRLLREITAALGRQHALPR